MASSKILQFTTVCTTFKVKTELIYAMTCRKSDQEKMSQNTCDTRNINTFKRFQNMTKILFVCHGNICRSPMAEFVMKDLVKKAGLETEFHMESAATSTEEIGNPVYPPARRKLAEHGIRCAGKTSRQLTGADYSQYDFLIGMDRANIRNMNRICGGDPEGKIHLLMDYTDRPGDVADPWYTNDFETTWQDVLLGCMELLRAIRKELF